MTHPPLVITDGSVTFAPRLILTDEHERPSRNVVHNLLGSPYPDVTIRRAGARTGTLELFCLDRAAALAAVALHESGGPLRLEGGPPGVAMTYTLAEGAIRFREDMTWGRWVVSVPFQEVAS